MLEYGKFGKDAAREAIETHGRIFNVHHGHGYEAPEKIYKRLQKAVFLERELFSKPGFPGNTS